MTDKLIMYMLRSANSAEHLVRDAVVLWSIADACSGTDSISDISTSDRAGPAALAGNSL